MVQNPIILICFQHMLVFVPLICWWNIKYWYRYWYVNISANFRNIDIDKAILKNIDIDIAKGILAKYQYR